MPAKRDGITRETYRRRVAEMNAQQLRITLKAFWEGHSFLDALEIAMRFAEAEVDHCWQKKDSNEVNNGSTIRTD